MNKAQMFRSVLVLPMLAALMTSACDSEISNPTAKAPPIGDAPRSGIAAASIMEGPYNAAAVITCKVTVATVAVTCTSPQEPESGVPPRSGVGVYARLKFSSKAYKPDSGYVRTDISVKNMMLHRIGSYSGPVTGFKVFMIGTPSIISGSGTVTLANPDGTAEFTAPGQPYYFYNFKLKSLGVSGVRNWKFNVPPTVTKFSFSVYVSASIMPMILFDMSVAGNRDIYRINLDATDLVRLTNNPGVDERPTVAQDRVVWTSYRDGNAELYSKMLEDGTAVADTRLTTSVWNETRPSLSLDNMNLAWISNETGYERVFYGPSDASTRTQVPVLGTDAAIASDPIWKNNYSRIVYMSTASGKADFYTTAVDVGTVFPTLPGSSRPRFEPKFSHDQKTLAYTQGAPATPDNMEIWTFQTQTNTTTRMSVSSLPDIQPTFMHDGRIAWLAYNTATDWKIRWSTPDGLTVDQITITTGKPLHPVGVPLRLY